MSKKENGTHHISTCGRNRRSTWAGPLGGSGGGARNTTKGMKMVVTIEGTGSKRTSVTSYEAP